MKNLLIVSGLPRSGTSLLMRMLDVSGYNVIRDLEVERKLSKKRSNPYFYEHDCTLTGQIPDTGNAVKIMPWALDKLNKKGTIVWIDRNKEDIIRSWKAYNRVKVVKTSTGDYEKDYQQLIKLRQGDIFVSYENLKEDWKKIPEIKQEAIKEIRCK